MSASLEEFIAAALSDALFYDDPNGHRVFRWSDVRVVEGEDGYIERLIPIVAAVAMDAAREAVEALRNDVTQRNADLDDYECAFPDDAEPSKWGLHDFGWNRHRRAVLDLLTPNRVPDYRPEDFTDEAVELAQSYEPEGER